MTAAMISDRFETVAWVYSPSDLALLLSKFVDAGIHVQRVGLGHAAADPGMTTALGGVALRVREADAAEARALLAGLDAIPHRAPLFPGLLPVFLAMAFFGAGPPPRQIPTFVLDGAARREA
jgi:hypothetical protein